MRVLVVNAGSSSLKLRVVDGEEAVAGTDLGAPDDTTPDVVGRFASDHGPLDAVGHRVVHGGPHFRSPVVVDDPVMEQLEQTAVLAPLHNPPALAAMRATSAALASVPAVACFDTAFHASIPAEAAAYALPQEWVERWGVRRYGFHGLSCTWAVRRAAEMVGSDSSRRTVVCHLGGGASATAVVAGVSVDTTMGFTPLEGLVMATRPGDLDPGIVLWLLGHGVGLDDVELALEHGSGLAALSGVPGGDMREVLARRDAGDTRAAGAVAAYLHRLASRVASMAAAAGGLDTLVFTGGVGENAAPIRAELAQRLSWLGLELDPVANAGPSTDRDIARPGSPVRCLVVQAREDLVIAGECARLLSPAG